MTAGKEVKKKKKKKTIGSAAAPPGSRVTSHHSTMMRHGHQMAFKCDSKLSLPQERVKYVVVGNPEAVVGTSTAVYDLVNALPRRITREPPKSPRSSQTFSDFEPFMTSASIKKIDPDFKR